MNHIRPVFLKLAFTASMLLWASIAVTPATAAIVSYTFTGEVDKVHNLLNPPFFVDTSPTAMSVSMTVNGNTDLDGSARFGAYTITNFSLNIGGYYPAGIGTFNQVQIRDGLPGKDEFNVAVVSPSGAAPVGSRIPILFEIQLRGPASIFGSTDLPTTAPSISSFTNKNLWRLVFEPGSKRVSGVITAMTATVVPLPAAVILFGAGLVALVGLGAGSWRQRKNSFA